MLITSNSFIVVIFQWHFFSFLCSELITPYFENKSPPLSAAYLPQINDQGGDYLGRCTLAPSFQSAKFQPPTESRISLKKGDLSKQLTAPQWTLNEDSGGEANRGRV